jgi:ketosteroid isomerase-like protein
MSLLNIRRCMMSATASRPQSLTKDASPTATVERLRSAIDAHDLEALVALFSVDHRSEHPCHPDRSFTGAEQVRLNWSRILAGVPDMRARLVSSSVDGSRVWCEWEWSGTRRDGAPHLMRGTTITTVTDGLIAETRFYMEPVVADGHGVDAAIGEAMGGISPSAVR